MRSKVRALIDARMLVGRFSGVARFTTCLLREFARGDDIEPVALLSAADDRDVTLELPVETLRCDFRRDDREPTRRRRWEERSLARWVTAAKPDLFHATWNHGIPRGCPAASVLTIHDLIPWSEPITSLTALAARRAYRAAIRDSAGRADQIATVSEFTRDEVRRRLSVQQDTIQVIANGVDVPSHSPKVYPNDACTAGNVEVDNAEYAGVPKPYVLYVGGHEPRKNVQLVIRAVARHRCRHSPDLELHLTGSADALAPDALAECRSLGNPAKIEFLGTPTDNDLHSEIAGATALLMLSRAEGFGLPVLEAMARGCPVIAAPLAALPEVAGDCAIYVDPVDSDGVADAIHGLRTDLELRGRLTQRGLQRASEFSWARVAQQYAAVYRQALVVHCRRKAASPFDFQSRDREGAVLLTSGNR